MWSFGNQLAFKTVTASHHHMIAICNLPCQLLGSKVSSKGHKLLLSVTPAPYMRSPAMAYGCCTPVYMSTAFPNSNSIVPGHMNTRLQQPPGHSLTTATICMPFVARILGHTCAMPQQSPKHLPFTTKLLQQPSLYLGTLHSAHLPAGLLGSCPGPVTSWWLPCWLFFGSQQASQAVVT